MFSKYLVENLSYQLNNLFSSFTYLGSEYALMLGVFLLILIELRPSSAHKNSSIFIGIVSNLVSIIFLMITFKNIDNKGQYLFGEMLFLSDFNLKIKIIIGVIGFFTLIFFASSSIYKEKKFPFSEWIALILTIELGLNILVVSQNLLSIYVSLEIVSLVSYILVAMPFKKENAEATIKYLLFGTFTTGITLYGMSLLYGLTGSLDMTKEVIDVNFNAVKSPLWLVAFFLTCSSLFFKIASLPFHFWTPDVYQTGSSPLIAFLATAPKIAGAWLLMFFSNLVPLVWFPTWQFLLSIIAIFTITLGNLGALRQTDMKRMFAYSSIAHAGFMLIPAIIGAELGNAVFLYYAVVYSLGIFGCFWLAENYYQQYQTFEMKHLTGLGKYNAIFGIIFLVFLITLNGLPPTSGFSAKLFLFSVLWQSYTQNQLFILLVLMFVGILNTALSLFYYLKIPYLLFIKNQEIPEKIKIRYHFFINFIFALFIFLMFFWVNLFF